MRQKLRYTGLFSIKFSVNIIRYRISRGTLNEMKLFWNVTPSSKLLLSRPSCINAHSETVVLGSRIWWTEDPRALVRTIWMAKDLDDKIPSRIQTLLRLYAKNYPAFVFFRKIADARVLHGFAVFVITGLLDVGGLWGFVSHFSTGDILERMQ